jgi:hypothetical protein
VDGAGADDRAQADRVAAQDDLMDGQRYYAVLPYRWQPSWRATLQNFPRRGMRYLEHSQHERLIDSPPTPEAQTLHGFKVELGPWELIAKPRVREYFRATMTVTDPGENEVIEQYLIVDPYDLKTTWEGLTMKIMLAMGEALKLAYGLAMRYED